MLRNITEEDDMSVDEEYGLSLEDFEAYVLEKVASGEMDIGDVFKVKEKIEVAAKQGWTNREDYVQKPNATYDLGYLAYQYILDNGGSAEEALEYSRKEQGKTEDWLKKVKNRSTYKKYSKSIVEQHEGHPVQQQMVENKVFDSNQMRGIQRVNQLIRKLAECRNVNDRIQTLEEITKLQQKEIERVSTESAFTNVKIKHMEEMNMLKTMKPKDIARELWKRGCKQQYVSEVTGKSIPTIKRWWSEFRNE
jgi:hypothetical protein